MVKHNVKNIKHKLIDLDLSQAEIARQLGVSRTAIHLVIYGRTTSKRIEDYINNLFIRKAA